MSEYTFETAALKAVTIDAVKYNEEGLKNSLTPEAIQAVVPMAWGEYATAPIAYEKGSIVLGNNSADGGRYTVAIGNNANPKGAYDVFIGNNTASDGGGTHWSVAIGNAAFAGTHFTIAIGSDARSVKSNAIAIGTTAKVNSNNAITFGSQFTETTDSGNVTHTCTTEGTGSITIGAGANTLNNGDTESSNSVTIGCKAENKGADSVVLGAQASNSGAGTVVIGAGAKGANGDVVIGKGAEDSYRSDTNVAIGNLAKTVSIFSTSVGHKAESSQASVSLGSRSYAFNFCTAIGHWAIAKAHCSTAIGAQATVSDYGATVIRSTAADGTYTQLYFSGANTPLAKKYFPTAWEQKQDVDPETGNPLVDENGDPVMVDDPEKPIAGEAMMGFVAKDSAGNIIARGANMLSALFPYYTGEEDDPFAPTTMSLDGEKPEPVAFHPSDLDMPQEEPTTPEIEEYTPLPVYPIVEPEIEEINE